MGTKYTMCYRYRHSVSMYMSIVYIFSALKSKNNDALMRDGGFTSTPSCPKIEYIFKPYLL